MNQLYNFLNDFGFANINSKESCVIFICTGRRRRLSRIEHDLQACRLDCSGNVCLHLYSLAMDELVDFQFKLLCALFSRE